MSKIELPSREEIDHMGMRAFPAFVEEERDGCVYRAAGGLNYRNSSVTVLHPEGQEPNALLASVRAFSERHGIRPVLRLLGDPGELGPALARRGWAPFRDCLVMVRPGPEEQPAGPLVESLSQDIAPVSLDDWLGLQLRHKSLEGREADIFRQIFARLPETAVPVVYTVEGARVASALLYPEDGWLGLMNMLVTPEARGRGVGRRLLDRLLRLPYGFWLQVFEGNTPAVRLYDATGFATHYPYAYWAENRQGT